MKKFLFFITLIILFSCEKQEKDEPRCWTCETTTVINIIPTIGDYPKTNYEVESVCGFTEAGIRKYEIANSDTITYVRTGFTQVDYKVTKCDQ